MVILDCFPLKTGTLYLILDLLRGILWIFFWVLVKIYAVKPKAKPDHIEKVKSLEEVLQEMDEAERERERRAGKRSVEKKKAKAEKVVQKKNTGNGSKRGKSVFNNS